MLNNIENEKKGLTSIEKSIIVVTILISLVPLLTFLDKPQIISYILSALTCLGFYIYFFYILGNGVLNILPIAILIISAICILYNFSYYEDGFPSFQFCSKYLLFAESIIYMEIASNISLCKKAQKIIVLIYLIIPISFVVSYYIFQNRITYGVYLTLGFSNSNLVGMWIALSMLIIVVSSTLFRSGLFLGGAILCLFLLGIILYSVLCRSAIFSLLTLIILYAIYRLKKEVLSSKWFSLVITYIPLLFFLVYYAYIDTLSYEMDTMESALVSEVKKVDSRYDMWSFALSSFQKHIFIGDYYGISDGLGASQMHNTHVDVFSTYGIIVYTLWSIYVFTVINKIGKLQKTTTQYIAFICFISCYIIGVFEAAMVSGAVGLQQMMLMFLAHTQQNQIFDSIE